MRLTPKVAAVSHVNSSHRNGASSIVSAYICSKDEEYSTASVVAKMYFLLIFTVTVL